MTIGIDFDGTWTLDPGFWNAFYKLCKQSGHSVVMVTGRSVRSEDMSRYSLPEDLTVIFTSGQMKERAALKSGWKVDVWIDDMPAMIQECAVLLPTADKFL